MSLFRAIASAILLMLTLTVQADNIPAEDVISPIVSTDVSAENDTPALTEQIADTDAAPVTSAATGLPHDLSPWGMYLAADWVVKAVMIGLLLASVATWSVWIFKMAELYQARKAARNLLTILIKAGSFRDCNRLPDIKGDGIYLLEATSHELKLSAAGPASDDGIKERIAARLERIQLAAASKMNKGTGILATIGSVAPFVGLFGTVWGIMNSFIGIAESQTTNLAVVAPGIAEALLATAVGLVAAIPAVVIYNYFARAIGLYRADLADISTALLTLVSRDLDRSNPDSRTIDFNAESKSAKAA